MHLQQGKEGEAPQGQSVSVSGILTEGGQMLVVPACSAVLQSVNSLWSLSEFLSVGVIPLLQHTETALI